MSDQEAMTSQVAALSTATLPPTPPTRSRRNVTIWLSASVLVIALAIAAVAFIAASGAFATRPNRVQSIEHALHQSLAAKGRGYTISCPPEQGDFRPGTTFTCTAADARGIEGTITVTMLTDDGQFRYSLKPGAPEGSWNA